MSDEQDQEIVRLSELYDGQVAEIERLRAALAEQQERIVKLERYLFGKVTITDRVVRRYDGYGNIISEEHLP